jgi:hypothetical protein
VPPWAVSHLARQAGVEVRHVSHRLLRGPPRWRMYLLNDEQFSRWSRRNSL